MFFHKILQLEVHNHMGGDRGSHCNIALLSGFTWVVPQLLLQFFKI